DAALAESRADRRRWVGGARGHLQLDIAFDFLGHEVPPFFLSGECPQNKRSSAPDLIRSSRRESARHACRKRARIAASARECNDAVGSAETRPAAFAPRRGEFGPTPRSVICFLREETSS